MIEVIFGRLSGDYAIGNLIRMAFVRVPQLPDPALQLHATTLLHYVGGLMRRRTQVGRGSECHVISGCERLGLHAPRARCRRGIGMGLDIADVMAAE